MPRDNVRAARTHDQRRPEVFGAGVKLEMPGHVHEPRDRDPPLDVARDPEEIVGDAAQHGSASSTQVSFAPPPCELFTTSDPLRSATRVNPPGVTFTSRPNRMNGRRST
jgi:hypothetical protein